MEAGLIQFLFVLGDNGAGGAGVNLILLSSIEATALRWLSTSILNVSADDDMASAVVPSLLYGSVIVYFYLIYRDSLSVFYYTSYWI